QAGSRLHSRAACAFFCEPGFPASRYRFEKSSSSLVLVLDTAIFIEDALSFGRKTICLSTLHHHPFASLSAAKGPLSFVAWLKSFSSLQSGSPYLRMAIS